MQVWLARLTGFDSSGKSERTRSNLMQICDVSPQYFILNHFRAGWGIFKNCLVPWNISAAVTKRSCTWYISGCFGERQTELENILQLQQSYRALSIAKTLAKICKKKFMGQHVNLNMVLPLLHASAAVRCKPLPQDRKIMLRFSLPGKTVLEAQNTSNLSCPFREHPIWYTIYDHLLVGFHRGTHKTKGTSMPPRS